MYCRINKFFTMQSDKKAGPLHVVERAFVGCD